MKPPLLAGLLSIAALLTPALATANEPGATLTLYVHGFEQAGAGRQGSYGEPVRIAAIDSIAALVGLPVATSIEGLAPNAAIAVEFYGDTAPAYYSPADVAGVASVTAQWGGGVPRYALIVAKFIDEALERSGARQVNIVSASFGSLVARWMLEKDVEGLASRGVVARWLTAEGVLCGNWAASHEEFVDWVNAVDPLSIDVEHMDYAWVETHLHAPRTQADNPLYAGILIGQIASTDDSYLDGGLSALMAGTGDYQANDGVQALSDTYFHDVTTRSMLLGFGPTLSLFPVDHYELSNHRGAWAQVATFLTQRRRVRITMTRAQVTNLQEAQQPWWDWRPAEVVLQSAVSSPAVRTRWGIHEPLCVVRKEGAVAPLRRFQQNGETQDVNQVVFDDLILDAETQLQVDLHGEEIDYDARYGVYETIGDPYDELGSGSLLVSTLASGSYTFSSASWNCTLEVTVFEYPFDAQVGVAPSQGSATVPALEILPNPHRSSVRFVLSADARGAGHAPASARVFDLTGRCVRSLPPTAAGPLTWDGRDDAGNPLAPGIYMVRVEAEGRVWLGRSCLVR